jgi:cytochrome P450
VVQEPYEDFGRVREADPLHWNELYELWLITRYDDLVRLTRHGFSRRLSWVAGCQPAATNPVNHCGAQH